MKKSKGITLIALIITIIILLILAGISIAMLTGDNGILKKATTAKSENNYASAKEIIQMKLIEIQMECKSQEKEFTLLEIEKGMSQASDITIEKIHYSDTEPETDLKGLVVSANQYSEYKFLIGKNGTIEAIISGETQEKPNETTINIPNVEDGNTASSIEITTYIVIKNNTINTLNLANIEETNYVIKNKTENLTLRDNNILVANNKADSYDCCEILITGKYQGKNYTNNMTVYVEPQYRTVVTDKNGTSKEAFAIYTEQDLIRMQEIVSSGANTSCYAKLMNDLNLNANLYQFDEKGKITFEESAKKYQAIGSVDHPFSGILDGNNHNISGIYIKEALEANGFFGMLSEEGEVKNLNLQNSFIDKAETTGTSATVGGLVGYNEGRVERCKVQNSTLGKETILVGGLVGINNGDLIECATLEIYLISWGRNNSAGHGGIAGINGTNYPGFNFKKNSTIGNIYRCYSTGYIEDTETGGGIASHNGVYGGTGNIYDCYSTMHLSFFQRWWNCWCSIISTG